MKDNFRIKKNLSKGLLIVFGVSMIFNLPGCNKKADNDNNADIQSVTEEPICDGVTNNTDYDAPKVINSDNLVGLLMGFYHEDKYDSSMGRYYTFILESGDDGKIVLKDSYNGEGFEVTQSVLDGAQAIIKKYDLAKANGVNRITAGLPPEYERCNFKAEYDSGEYISFSENSDPSSEWGREFIDYFAPIFAEHGDNQYMPPEISGVITCFNLEVKKDNLLYQYCTETENRIYRCIYDCDTGENVDETIVDSASEYYEGLMQIISDNNIRDFENMYTASDFDNTSDYYDFYIELDNGDRLSGASCDADEISLFRPVENKIMKYIDEYVDKKTSE